MRVSFCHLISLSILISSAFVSAGPAPDNTGGGSGSDSCSACWVQQRNKLPACQNIPQSEINEFSQLADQQIIDKKNDFPHLIPCLCALVPNVPSIINTCNCNANDASGLTKESVIVKALCADVTNTQTAKPNATNTNNNPTNTSGNNKSGYGTGDDSTPGNASGDGSGDGNATDTSTTTNDSSPTPAANAAAVSAQWAGSFVITLGAVIVGLTL